MSSNRSFVISYRNEEAYQLIRKHGPSFILFYYIAHHARRSPVKIEGLEIGEVWLGKEIVYNMLKMSDMEYRTAKKKLDDMGWSKFMSFKTGTIGKLTYIGVFNPNFEDDNEVITNGYPAHIDGSNKTFIKSFRNDKAYELIKKDRMAFFLIYYMAHNARRTPDEIEGLRIGEVRLSNEIVYDKLNMKEDEYIEAKEVLENKGWAEFIESDDETIGKVIYTGVFDPNFEDDNEVITNLQPVHTNQVTPNNNEKNGNNDLINSPIKEKNINVSTINNEYINIGINPKKMSPLREFESTKDNLTNGHLSEK